MISTQMNGNQFPVRIGPTVEHGISALSTLSIDSYIACLTLIPDLAVSLGITGVAVAIYYHVDGSTLAPTTQLQTLAASNCGLAIPSDSPVTGIEIDFSAGYPYGDPADLTVQLTLNGEPIGIVRNLTVGPWATDYEFGGPADIWGLGPLTGADINGPTGLGIDISGDLPVGARVNLNNLRGVVHYLGPKEAHGNTTLVYDIEAKGWSVDVYSPVVNCHLWVVGANQLLTGCVDGTVRELTSGGSEVGTAILGTRCESGGDARALKRIGDVFIKALVNGSNRINLALYQTRFTVPLGGFAPTSLPPPPITGSGSLASFTVDFSAGFGNDVDDIAALLSWPLGSGNILDLWQPDWTELPEVIQDRPSDWTDCGIAGNKLIRGMIIEMDSFNADKAIKVQRSDSETLVAPDQALVKVNGQTLVPFTFAPFTAHQLRIISTDGVPWRYWGAKFICDPWPDYTPLYSAWMNLGSEGAKYIRGLLLPMDTNGALANFRVVTSDGDTVSFSATTPTAHKTPVAFAFTPPVVAHHVQIQCLSNAALWTEEAVWMADPYPEIIPAYTPIMEVAGPDNKFVQGIKIVGDSANLPVQFRILYDGGQVGPLTEARTFNGKQTQVYSFNPPFVAHDLQIVPQSSVRIWTDDSKWVFQPYADSATIWQTEASSFGMAGWIHLFQMNLAYIATQPVTVTATTDQGTFTMTYPAGGSGVNPAKVLMKPPANKWKICSFTITSPAKLSIWKDSCEIWLKQWGWMGEYQKINPFGGPSSPSAEI